MRIYIFHLHLFVCVLISYSFIYFNTLLIDNYSLCKTEQLPKVKI